MTASVTSSIRSRRNANSHTKQRDVSGVTAAIAEAVAGLTYRSVPSHVVERAKDLVLDHIGVTLYGATLPWSTKIRSLLLEEGGRAVSTIYGSRRVPPRAAALANGAAGHAIEFDDTHDESLSHPGAVILPAAFAVAEQHQSSGRAFLTAMIAGYEAHCRFGAPLGNAIIRRGFHPTATFGVFGAAAAAGKLLGANAAGITSAFGSGASMSSGIMQFTEDPQGTMIKRLHAGLPAQQGLWAAQLASRGFTGPRWSIEGTWGFAKVFANVDDLGRSLQGLGERFEIERITIKLYPCCKMFHSLIEAIENCQRERPFTAKDVVGIEPFGPRNMIDTHMKYRPESTMSAQYSLPWACAAAIVSNPKDPESFSEKRLGNKEALRIADLVKPVVNDEHEAMFPRRFAGGVRIKLRDGTTLTNTVLDARSSPDLPIGREEVQGKFRVLTNGILSAARQERIMDTVAQLERLKEFDSFATLLRGRGGSRA